MITFTVSFVGEADICLGYLLSVNANFNFTDFVVCRTYVGKRESTKY